MDDQKHDPLGDEFFRPLVNAEKASNFLFIASATLSLLVLLVPRQKWEVLADAIAVAFPTSVALLFFVSIAIRLYFSPRAQQARLQDFLSHAYDTTTHVDRSEKYYNNDATSPSLRVIAQTLESAHFTKFIARKMCGSARIIIALYFTCWLLFITNRNSELTSIGIAAQILFSEQVLARWLRLEWLRSKSEVIYEHLLTAIQNKKNNGPQAVALFTSYEIVKANAAISLSSAIFKEHSDRLTNEWDTLRKRLNI